MHPSTTLPPAVTLAVLAAAVTHATWNAIAHGIKDQLLAFALIGAGGILGGIPLLILAAAPRRDSWGYLLVSGAIHVSYNLLLMRCYRYGEFSQVYPLARGISPLVVSVLALVFVHERPAPVQVAGVLVVSAGLAVLVFGGRPPGRAALLAAIGTGLTIAAYTTVDGLGVRRSGSPGGYIGWLMLLESLCVPMYALARRRRVLLRQPPRILASGVAAGALSVLAYGLVLWAQTRGALAPIAALRETSVIFGAIAGALVFHEPFGRSRIAATVIVVAGIGLLNTGLSCAFAAGLRCARPRRYGIAMVDGKGAIQRLDLGYIVRPAEEAGTAHPRVEPVLGYVLRHDDAIVLFDTGIALADPETDNHYRPVRRPVAQALADIGLSVQDISLVSNCHLHFDHCGGNALFAGRPVFVQAGELAAARGEGYTIPEAVDFPGARYRELDGEAEILPGVWLIPTPGHTDGHQSLVARQGDGTVILAGQAHDFASEYATSHHALRAVRDGLRPPLPLYPRWLERLAGFDPSRVLFAHDCSVWEPA